MGYPLDNYIRKTSQDTYPVSIHHQWGHMADGEDGGPYEHTYTCEVVIETKTRVIVFKRDFTGTSAKLSNDELETEAKQWGQDTQNLLFALLKTSQCGITNKPNAG